MSDSEARAVRGGEMGSSKGRSVGKRAVAEGKLKILECFFDCRILCFVVCFLSGKQF